MNEQQRDYAKAKQAKRRVEMKMEAREKSFLKGRGLMDSEGTEADSLYKIEDEALFDMACKEFDLLPGMGFFPALIATLRALCPKVQAA